MTKKTKAAFLPQKVQKNLKLMGEQIKLARKRRKLHATSDMTKEASWIL